MRGAVAAIGPTFVSFKVAMLDLENNLLAPSVKMKVKVKVIGHRS